MSATVPLISVLIPTYKPNPAFLREAIDSILAQTEPDFELLLLDDSPSDPAVREVVESYTDPRIRFIDDGVNRGISGARNRLLEEARGEFVAIMDHDDVSFPERFRKQVDYLRAHPEVGVVGCLMERSNDGKFFNYPEKNGDIRLAFMYDCAVPHTGTMLRRCLLTKYGVKYDPIYSPAEDYALFSSLLPYTSFYNIPEPLVRYRLYPENTSKTQRQRMWRSAALARAKAQTADPLARRQYRAIATQVTRVKLFGCLTILGIVTDLHITRVKLFNLIPILTIKRKRRIRGIY